MSHLIAYKPRNNVKFQKTFEELVQFSKETVEDLMRFIFDAKYKFLFLECTSGQLY